MVPEKHAGQMNSEWYRKYWKNLNRYQFWRKTCVWKSNFEQKTSSGNEILNKKLSLEVKCWANIMQNMESEMAMNLGIDENDEEWEREAALFIFLVDAKVHSHLTFHVSRCNFGFVKRLFVVFACDRVGGELCKKSMLTLVFQRYPKTILGIRPRWFLKDLSFGTMLKLLVV